MEFIRSKAMLKSISKISINYSQDVSSHRRNLLFASVLGFVVFILTPINGVYEVNLGVLSGEIKQPEYVYFGVAFLLAYQIICFWYLNRKSVSSIFNREKIENVFMFELAAIFAARRWHEITERYRLAKVNTAISNFERSFDHKKHTSSYTVRAVTTTVHVDEMGGLRELLLKDARFNSTDMRGEFRLDFVFTPSFEDYRFLAANRDNFWVLKASDFLEHLFPLLLGFCSLMGGLV